jgi:uncharacterized protein YbbC (DUF1343 family)
MHHGAWRVLLLTTLLTFGCTSTATHGDGAEPAARDDRIMPGITVLLEDSAALIAGKRVGLITNQTGIDRERRSDIDLLVAAGSRERGPRLVSLFSPEHGIRGTEDRTNLASEVDARTGLPVHSLYGRTTLAPPDSTLDDLDALLIDLQDIGTRTWTYVGTMVYAMRAAASRGLPVIVLDRPNPITATRVEGPMLDTTLAFAGTHSAARAAKPYALHRVPLRHGLTMGELARFYNDVLSLGAELHVVPVRNYRREMWFDDTGLPWVRPSPNMPSLTSALLYPGLVAFEGTNLSVGRGTADAFQRLGAPWLDAQRVVDLLRDRHFPGVRFEAERFTPESPTDGKYGGMSLPGVRIVVTNRDVVHSTRIGAALLWAIARTNGDSLRINAAAFDDRFGSPSARAALVQGEDPDSVIDRDLPEVVTFRQRSRRYWLY